MSPRALVVLSLVAGCAPSLTVIRQAQPNPFGSALRFVVEPFTVGDLRTAADPVLPETLDEGRLNRVFIGSLSSGGIPVDGPSDFTVRTHLGKGAPRWSAGSASSDGAALHVWVGVFDRDGRALDELELACRGEVYLCAQTAAAGVAHHLVQRAGIPDAHTSRASSDRAAAF
jgi:hypothetical protein